MAPPTDRGSGAEAQGAKCRNYDRSGACLGADRARRIKKSTTWGKEMGAGHDSRAPSGPLCSDTWQVLLIELAAIAELGAAKASVAEIPTAVTRSAARMANKCRNGSRVVDFISASIAGGFDIALPSSILA